MEQVPSGVSFDGSEFKSIDASSDSDIFSAPPVSLTSDDEPGDWGTDAKLKMKGGVVSVTVEQHTECRLHGRGLGEFLRETRNEIVFKQDESSGRHLITVVVLVLAVIRRCHLGSECQGAVFHALFFTWTPALALMVVRMGGDAEVLHQRRVDARGCHGVPCQQNSAHMTTRGQNKLSNVGQPKVTLSSPTQMQLQGDMRGVHDRVIEDTEHDGHW